MCHLKSEAETLISVADWPADSHADLPDCNSVGLVHGFSELNRNQ